MEERIKQNIEVVLNKQVDAMKRIIQDWPEFFSEQQMNMASKKLDEAMDVLRTEDN